MAEYGLLGAKLSHSFSKDIHNILGYDYDLIECKADELQAVLNDKSRKGFNVTVPYKELVIPMLDVVDDSVSRIGACNTIVNKDGKLFGYNTDYYGLKDLIESQGIAIGGKNVLILGSGGTCKTAMCVVADMGGKYTIVSRSGDVNYDNVYEKCASAQVVINTTPYGMNPNLNHLPLIDLTRLKEVEFVVDVIFNPYKTALIISAEQLGIKAVNGLRMLVVQAIYAGRLFTRQNIDVDVSMIMGSLYKKYCNIFVIGMPGSGKSTIAKMLAFKLGRVMLDSDNMIEQDMGATCKEIITTSGEDAFRQTESQVIKLLAGKRSAVVASGGGAIKLAENRYYMSCNGIVVYISRRLGSLAQDGRPLSSSPEAIAKLYRERKSIYESLADITVSNNGNADSLPAVVDKIIGGLGL